jgi:hypothetical protein
MDADAVERAPDDRLPDRVRKGRGAVGNAAGRYEPTRREAIDDGWGTAEDDDPPPLRTTVTTTPLHRSPRRN